MQVFIFDNVTNTLQIDDYNILLIKEFANLWEPERNKCKEDKNGTKRLRAYKELTFIYLVLDFKSPYFKSPLKISTSFVSGSIITIKVGKVLTLKDLINSFSDCLISPKLKWFK